MTCRNFTEWDGFQLSALSCFGGTSKRFSKMVAFICFVLLLELDKKLRNIQNFLHGLSYFGNNLEISIIIF